MNYSEIKALPASAFLDPDNLVSGWPCSPGKAEKKYQEGLKVSREARRVTLSVNGVWGARLLDGASLQSYEGIGYHAGTEHLLRGFLDGPAPITVYRFGEEGIEAHEIKGRTEP